MSHPFEKMFEKVLKKSLLDENLVLIEALRLKDKGYSSNEILTVLTKLQKSLIDDTEARIVEEARYDFEQQL